MYIEFLCMNFSKHNFLKLPVLKLSRLFGAQIGSWLLNIMALQMNAKSGLLEIEHFLAYSYKRLFKRFLVELLV